MKRKIFTKEFKLEAVRLLESSGRAALMASGSVLSSRTGAGNNIH